MTATFLPWAVSKRASHWVSGLLPAPVRVDLRVLHVPPAEHEPEEAEQFESADVGEDDHER